MVASKFWFVWNPAGRAPTYLHDSAADARKEAVRLASVNPGQEFTVLESVGSCRTNNVVWEDHKSVTFSRDGCSDYTAGTIR